MFPLAFSFIIIIIITFCHEVGKCASITTNQIVCMYVSVHVQNTYVYIRTLQNYDLHAVERAGGATTPPNILNSELNPDFSIIIFNLLPSFLNPIIIINEKYPSVDRYDVNH